MPIIELKNKGLIAYISEVDEPRVTQHNWFAVVIKGKTYAATNIQGKNVLLHRFIKRATNPSVFIDHKNGDGLNNRRNNLRRVTAAQNAANKSASGESKYLGVHRMTVRQGKRRFNYWVAVCSSGGKRSSKNFPFTTQGEYDAAMYYNQLAVKMHGKYARLNKPIAPKDIERRRLQDLTRQLRQINRE